MLTESEKRAAALAVDRYGVDRERIKEAAKAVLQAHAEGRTTDLLNAMVGRKLLSPSQADELRQVLSAGRTPATGKGRAAEQDPDATLPGSPLDFRRLGEFRILRQLGEGGMGSVYLGYQEEQGCHVAIKVLPDHLAKNQAYIDRFYREAKSIALLDHPSIVHGIAVGQDQPTGKHFMVLEYVDGPSSRDLLDRFGRLPVGDAVHITLDIARALEHAHSRNIVHRDIKPDNILLTKSGVAKLADLGLAKRTDAASHLTGTRQGFGTPDYMPYEQAIDAKQADGRADIYALGATLYHLVTGQLPFPGGSPVEVVEKKDVGVFVPASEINATVPAVLDRILGKMLARSAQDRYQMASELIVDLERSKLAAQVPTFVDPDAALQDPQLRTRLAPPLPTRPDFAVRSKQPAARAGKAGLWYLRYRNRDGQWCKARATTQQIVMRLQQGRITTSVVASRQLQGRYRPLATYPEFSPWTADTAGGDELKRDGTEEAKEARQRHQTGAKAATPPKRRSRWLVSVGRALLTAVAVPVRFVVAAFKPP